MKANSLSFQWLHSSLSPALSSTYWTWCFKKEKTMKSENCKTSALLTKKKKSNSWRQIDKAQVYAYQYQITFHSKLFHNSLNFFSDRKNLSTLLVRVLRNRYLAWQTAGCAVQTMTWSSGQLNKAGYFLTIKVHPTERAIDPPGLAPSASCSPGVESCKRRNAFLLRRACQRWVSICTRTKASGEGNQSFKKKEKLSRSSPSKGLAQMKKSSCSA